MTKLTVEPAQNLQCKRISDDPSVPCEYCLSGFIALPCFRGKITDCSLYRKTNNSPFETNHPLTGPDFGNFSRSKIWTAGESRVFECGQGHGTTLRLRVRPFLPPELSPAEQIDNKGMGAKGRRLYAIPWAIVDLDEAIAEVHRYLDSSVSSYIHQFVGGSDSLFSPIFWHARRLAEGPNPVRKYPRHTQAPLTYRPSEYLSPYCSMPLTSPTRF